MLKYVVSRKSKFVFFVKFWFQKIHPKAKKTVASLLKISKIPANFYPCSTRFSGTTPTPTPSLSPDKAFRLISSPLIPTHPTPFLCTAEKSQTIEQKVGSGGFANAG